MNFFKFLILSLLFIVTSQNSYSQNKLNKSKGNSLLNKVSSKSENEENKKNSDQ